MPTERDFERASERLELAINSVGLIITGEHPLNSVFAALTVLRDDALQYGDLLNAACERLLALSNDPIKWDHGRGQSGLAQGRDATFPHFWSSAHEAAASIVNLALGAYLQPLELSDEVLLEGKYERLSPGQIKLFKRLLSKSRRSALAMSIGEVAQWQERIRRERAKLLQELQPLPHRLSEQPKERDGNTVLPNSQRQSMTPKLTVEIEHLRAYLDRPTGRKLFELPSELVARWLKILADRPGQWFRPKDYEEHDSQLKGVVPHGKRRLLAKKCPELDRLIETSKHDGMRFNPDRA